MRDDDHCLRQRHDRQNGNIQENILEVINGQEGRRPQCDSDHQNQNEKTDSRFAETDESPEDSRYEQQRFGWQVGL